MSTAVNYSTVCLFSFRLATRCRFTSSDEALSAQLWLHQLQFTFRTRSTDIDIALRRAPHLAMASFTFYHLFRSHLATFISASPRARVQPGPIESVYRLARLRFESKTSATGKKNNNKRKCRGMSSVYYRDLRLAFCRLRLIISRSFPHQSARFVERWNDRIYCQAAPTTAACLHSIGATSGEKAQLK